MTNPRTRASRTSLPLWLRRVASIEAHSRLPSGLTLTTVASVVRASPENTGLRNSKVISRAMKFRSPPIFVGSVAVNNLNHHSTIRPGLDVECTAVARHLGELALPREPLSRSRGGRGQQGRRDGPPPSPQRISDGLAALTGDDARDAFVGRPRNHHLSGHSQFVSRRRLTVQEASPPTPMAVDDIGFAATASYRSGAG
jgi:hypothetical protein